MWWDAVAHSDTLLANGLPCIPCLRSAPVPLSCSHPRHSSKKRKTKTTPSTLHSKPALPLSKKHKTKPKSGPQSPKKQAPNSLLALMSTNISTMKRVRRTHARFAALSTTAEDPADDAPGEDRDRDKEDVRMRELDVGEREQDTGERDGEAAVDDRPWETVGSGVEMGERGAEACLAWMGGKVLEHAGFQGVFFYSQRIWLFVLTGLWIDRDCKVRSGRAERGGVGVYAECRPDDQVSYGEVCGYDDA